MDSTSASLLGRLKKDDAEGESAWRQFVELYAPLVFHWGKSQGLNATDSSELVQEVMATLVTTLADFEYDPAKHFRGWLRTVAVNRTRDLRRRQSLRPATGMEGAVPTASAEVNGTDMFDEAAYRGFLVKRALELMKTEFPEHAWRACWSLTVEGRPGREVAAELGISENLVYVSKSRILKRLREELDGLVE